MIRHTPFIRRLTYLMGFTGIGLGVLSMLVLLGYRAWLQRQQESCETWLQEVILPQEISGSVLEVIPRDSCHVVLRLDSGSELLFCQCAGEPGSPVPATGDSLYKPQQSLSLDLCPSPELCATIQYPCCE